MAMGSESDQELTDLLLMTVREVPVPKGTDKDEMCAPISKPLIREMIGDAAMM